MSDGEEDDVTKGDGVLGTRTVGKEGDEFFPGPEISAENLENVNHIFAFHFLYIYHYKLSRFTTSFFDFILCCCCYIGSTL
jgi:hypothetical protein